MEIGSKIKALRLKCNLTQEELADRCELSKSFISQLENDYTSPSIETLNDIIGKRDFLLTEICRMTEPDSIDIEDNLALIAIVGRSMVKAKGTAARIFRALADASINIKMIDQGSSELNIIVGVDESDYVKALQTIYNEFVK